MKRLALVLICAVLLPGGVWSSQSRPMPPVYPGATWARVDDLKQTGYCQAGLDAVTTELKGLTTTAMTVVVGGRVLFDYGPQDEVSYLASVRKSILAMMFGKYVEQGTVKLD